MTQDRKSISPKKNVKPKGGGRFKKPKNPFKRKSKRNILSLNDGLLTKKSTAETSSNDSIDESLSKSQLETSEFRNTEQEVNNDARTEDIAPKLDEHEESKSIDEHDLPGDESTNIKVYETEKTIDEGCAITDEKLAEDIFSTETTNSALIDDLLPPSQPGKIEPHNINHAGNNDLPTDKSTNVKVSGTENSRNEGCAVNDEMLAQGTLSTDTTKKASIDRFLPLYQLEKIEPQNINHVVIDGEGTEEIVCGVGKDEIFQNLDEALSESEIEGVSETCKSAKKSRAENGKKLAEESLFPGSEAKDGKTGLAESRNYDESDLNKSACDSDLLEKLSYKSNNVQMVDSRMKVKENVPISNSEEEQNVKDVLFETDEEKGDSGDYAQFTNIDGSVITRSHRVLNDFTNQDTSVSDDDAKENTLPRTDRDKLKKTQFSVFRLMGVGSFSLFLGVGCYIIGMQQRKQLLRR